MYFSEKTDSIRNAEQVAQILGISKQTLIRYEKKGIFPKARRNSINHWREYNEADLHRLRQILGRG